MNHLAAFTGISLVALALGACSDDGASTETNAERLARYRRALPSRTALQVTVPTASGSGVVGAPADAPPAISDIVHDVNGAVVNMLTVMETVTSLPPTLYNAESKEYFWGPGDNDDGVGYIGVYLRENAADDDFRYSYAVGRLPSQDIAGFVPVIWGGANPDEDNDDQGTGAILWDFEANHDFELENNANYDEDMATRGRFVSVFGRGPSEDDADRTVTLVYAAFRNFSDQGEGPIDAEYLYGKVEDGANDLQFVDVMGEQDFAAGDNEAPESMHLRAAYFNSGVGRAETSYSGGNVSNGESAYAEECWNVALDRTYYSWTLGQLGDVEGQPSDCGPVFSQTLEALHVPSLDDVPQDQRDLLGELAENGVPAT